MHGDDELCHAESSALFRVREVPDVTKSVVIQPGLLEYLFGVLA